jgi:hypothetical protein
MTKQPSHCGIGATNDTWFCTAPYHLRRCSVSTTFEWVKVHNGKQGNEHADDLACAGATKHQDDPIDMSVPNNFNLSGVKLTSISHTTVYHGIRTAPTQPSNKHSTTINLDMTHHAIHRLSNSPETDASIWHRSHNPSICKLIQFFFFFWHPRLLSYRAKPFVRHG